MMDKWRQIIIGLLEKCKEYLYHNVYMKIRYVKLKSKEHYYQDPMVMNIKKAKSELDQSKNYFASVSDPDLVDYASHKILAHQSYYSYLLKIAKAEKITSKE